MWSRLAFHSVLTHLNIYLHQHLTTSGIILIMIYSLYVPCYCFLIWPICPGNQFWTQMFSLQSYHCEKSGEMYVLMHSCDVSITYDCAPCGNKSEHNMSSHASQPIKTSRGSLDYSGNFCKKKNEINLSF